MRPRFGVCVADAVLALSINIALMAQYAPHVPRKAEKKGPRVEKGKFSYTHAIDVHSIGKFPFLTPS